MPFKNAVQHSEQHALLNTLLISAAVLLEASQSVAAGHVTFDLTSSKVDDRLLDQSL